MRKRILRLRMPRSGSAARVAARLAIVPPAVAVTKRSDPPDTFGDESFGDRVSYKTPAVYAQVPPRLNYGWLWDLRAATEGHPRPLKWDHLRTAMVAAPHGGIAVGAEQALSQALLVVLDLDAMRSRESAGTATVLNRWLSDVFLTDGLLEDNPLAHMSGAKSTDLRTALQLPEPLPRPDDPGFLRRAVNGMWPASSRHIDRPEGQAHLLYYSLRSTATGAAWLDSEVWAKHWERLLPTRRFFLREHVRDAVVREVLQERRSIERGDSVSVVTVNALLGASVPERPLGEPPTERPSFVAITEHCAKDFEEGEAADMAAGWAREIYNNAGSPGLGVEQLRCRFKGVIFNGRLYQR